MGSHGRAVQPSVQPECAKKVGVVRCWLRVDFESEVGLSYGQIGKKLITVLLAHEMKTASSIYIIHECHSILRSIKDTEQQL